MRLVDLTQPIRQGMAVYPGDPEVRTSPALAIATDGVAVTQISLGSHTGTHIDAPSHVIQDGQTVDDLPLSLLVGPARVLRDAAPVAAAGIGGSDIAGGLPHLLPERVCIATGWDRFFGGAEMLRHPHLSLEFAQALWERGARVLGVDTLSPDPTGACSDDDLGVSDDPDIPVHAFWLGRGGAIVENLTNLNRLPAHCELALLPLPLAGGDGAPIRALARFAAE